MAIKAIIFDCFGVLVSSARNILSQDYPQYKTQIDDIGHQSDYGLITRRQFNESLAKIFGISASEIDARYWDASIRDEKAIDWVRSAKSSGKFKIGMLSNVGPGFFEKFFDSSQQTKLFDEVILSSNVGMAKPEVMIFELTAQRLGVLPGECVMIDDSALNTEAAINAGMQAIRYLSLGQAQTDLQKLLEPDRA